MLLAPQQVYQFAVANPDVMKHFPRYCDCDAMGTPPTIHKRSVSSTHRKPSVWPSGDHVTIDLVATDVVQVLVAKDNSGDTRYLYGVTRIGEQQSGGWLYHLTDALGSVRQLVDSSGDMELARGYTLYGEPLWANGTASSRYAFTGEDYDAYIKLLFLRARYYSSYLHLWSEYAGKMPLMPSIGVKGSIT